MIKSTKERLRKLKKVLKKYKEKKLFIGVLGSPDPDGIGSAFAFQEILRNESIESDIIIFERISRPDNTEFVRKLEIELKHAESPQDLDPYDGYIIVDRQTPDLPLEVNREIPLIAHIDHHSGNCSHAHFDDIRPNAGSTSTIISSYFRIGVYSLDRENPLHRRIATALLFGIRTDTDDFFNAKDADFVATSFLSDFSDNLTLKKIFLRPAGKAFLETLKNALFFLRRENGWVTAFVGKVPKYARDSIGQTADFLAHSDAVTTVIVYGIVGNNVIGSMRTTDVNLLPDDFLKNALRNTFGSDVNCGGRKFAGGFQIPVKKIPCFKISETEDIFSDSVKELLDNLLKKPI
jgi:nanoRNase/pAp phosphatase (c-di-AMP/oligoRNAs hydrolase)